MKRAYAVFTAGSDSSAGTGIQTYLKTIASCGVWSGTVIAVLTVQNGNHIPSLYKEHLKNSSVIRLPP